MTIVSQPDISLNIVPAVTTVANTEQKVLFIGQKTAAGTATAGTLVTDIQNDNSWDTLFGERSMLAQGLRAARKLNPSVRFDVIPLDDPTTGNAPAVATVVFSGTATEDGTLTFYVSSRKNHSYVVSVVSGDDATAIGAKLETQIDLDDKVPATAAHATGTVTLTAANEGVEGNSTPLAYTGSVAGVTVTLNAFASGSGTVDTSGVAALIADQRYQTILSPYAYGTTVLTDILDPRFNENNDVLDGVGITTSVDSLSNLKAAGDALNSQSLAIIGEKLEDTTNLKGAAIIEQPYVRSSMVAAIRSLRLTQDADISRFVIGAGGPLDTFGGPAIASLPYFNSSLPDLIVPDVGLGFTKIQVEQLHDSGISIAGANRARNGVIMGEFVTTYKTDAAGNPDVSFKYVNYVDTSSQAREYMWNNMKKDFAQSRLTKGDVFANRNIHNEQTIRARLVSYFQTLSSADYLLLQAGEQAKEFFKSNLQITIDLSLGKVTIALKAPIVTQLRTIVGTFQLSFDI